MAEKSFADLEDRIYNELFKAREKQLRQGLKPHSKRTPYQDGMPEYVKMYRLAEGDKVLSLISQPFDSYEQAIHFSECFNDSFLCDSCCEEKDGKYYVYSGWIIKQGFLSYSVRSNGQYFEFANWS